MGIDVVDEISKLISRLDVLISSLEKSLRTAPEGSLEFKTKGGIPRPYVYTSSSGRTKYLGKGMEPLVKSLSQKKYDQRLLAVAKSQRKELAKTRERLSKGDFPVSLDDVLSSMPEPLKPFIEPNASTNEGFVKKWSARQIDAMYKNPPSDDCPFFTLKGEHVRSKSELLIADRLNFNGIPYHYEMAYSPDNGFTIMHPDFIILNPYTLKEWFWEHLGRMDDPEYASNAKQRLEGYAKYGMVPGKGLIVTFETSKSPLNTKYLDRLIELYLKK